MTIKGDFSNQTKRHDGVCAFCSVTLDTPWTEGEYRGYAHHLRPLRHGGSDSLENCVYLCWEHHQLIGHGMAPFGIDKQGGNSHTWVQLGRDAFEYWSVKMNVRLLTAKDAAAFQALRLEALQDSPTAFGSSYEEEQDRALKVVAQRLVSERNYAFGAFTKEEQLVGMTGLLLEQRPKTRHKASIWGMYVAPPFRKRGIGRTLLQAAIAQVTALPGVRQINLGVTTSNRAAYALYESCGFATYGVEREAMAVGGRYYDTAYMVLRLAGA